MKQLLYEARMFKLALWDDTLVPLLATAIRKVLR
jgi:hypothetical protein